jgi:hypothetical protein
MIAKKTQGNLYEVSELQTLETSKSSVPNFVPTIDSNVSPSMHQCIPPLFLGDIDGVVDVEVDWVAYKSTSWPI